MDYVDRKQLGYINSLIYAPMLWLAKFAVLLQLLHIFAPSRKTSKFMFWTGHSLIWTNLAFYISAFFVDLFRCAPIKNAWKVPQVDCMRGEVLWTVSAAFNAISDVLILFLPLRAIWELHLAPRRKIGVSAVFATGIM